MQAHSLCSVVAVFAEVVLEMMLMWQKDDHFHLAEATVVFEKQAHQDRGGWGQFLLVFVGLGELNAAARVAPAFG